MSDASGSVLGVDSAPVCSECRWCSRFCSGGGWRSPWSVLSVGGAPVSFLVVGGAPSSVLGVAGAPLALFWVWLVLPTSTR